ncbi:hypothetical protein F3Y22_tig00010533pilonHSYRG00164 [Hibiscus syriacus]|uniref:Uncharacterized protein n=1 Tax=Hibiscus syriacus TaxID=106335 RepID=A0A6A3CAW7_HIBSY|nr:ribonuclease 1-like [Hibiscus syriacus]KAE8724312.1 hypothetical protein F3Y22_tig00010533pilonHSYRG00164 [Hibiscus syriacus]
MAMKQTLAFAAVVVASLVVSAQGTDFAFYKLSLRWPTSLCIAKPASCLKPIPKIFTIHGLWPSFANGSNVPPYNAITNKCNVNPVPQTAIVAALSPIRTRLLAKWQNIYNETGFTNEGVWEIEWLHHGMCSDYPQDPLTYFTSGLDLAENSKYDPLTVLGVPASDTTPHVIQDLLDNVHRSLGFYPQISCNRPIKGKKQLYLKEIFFCFKRAMPPIELQNCPVPMDHTCNSLQPPQPSTVIFPQPITTNSLSKETPPLGRDIEVPPATSWPSVTCGLLVIGFLVLYILKRRNRLHEHVE